MTLRIGFAVGSDAIRMVGVERERVVWAGETPFDDARSLADAVAELMSTVRVPVWPRTRCAVAVGPGRSQAKRLHGLPPFADEQTLRNLVHENAGRFFLRNGIPLLTSAASYRDGEAWAGVVEAPIVEAMGAACERHRIVLTHALPAVVAIGCAFDGEKITWADGEVRTEIVRRDGRNVSLRRVRNDDYVDEEAARLVVALATLGDRGWRFADAYGAAITPDDAPLAVRLRRTTSSDRPVPRWRLTLAAMAASVALLVALVAPGVSAQRQTRRAEAALAALSRERSSAVAMAGDLDRVSRALGAVATFAARGRTATGLLGALASAFPAAAQLVSVQVDSSGGTVVALAPHAAQVVDRLDRMPQLAGVQIVGPVTREYVGSVEKERVTVRFRWGKERPFSAADGGQR